MEGIEIKIQAKKSESGHHTKAGNGSIQSWDGQEHCLGSAFKKVLPTQAHRSKVGRPGLGAGLLYFLMLWLAGLNC